MRTNPVSVVALAALLTFGGVNVAHASDYDGDGMPDRWERRHGLSPDKANAGGDPDRDHLRNIDEYLHHGDPQRGDTDGDGLPDGGEVHRWGSSVDRKDAVVGRAFGDMVCTDEGCDKELLGGARLTLEQLEGGSAGGSVVTNENGTFFFAGGSGAYRLTPMAVGGFATPGPMEFQIHTTAKVATFFYGEDTGEGLVGQVTQSPTCPGPQRPDQDCVGPLEGAPMRIEDSSTGEVVASATSTDGGRYFVDLGPGTYTIVPEPIGDSNLPSPPPPVEVTIGTLDPGPRMVNLDYDTGIR